MDFDESDTSEYVPDARPRISRELSRKKSHDITEPRKKGKVGRPRRKPIDENQSAIGFKQLAPAPLAVVFPTPPTITSITPVHTTHVSSITISTASSHKPKNRSRLGPGPVNTAKEGWAASSSRKQEAYPMAAFVEETSQFFNSVTFPRLLRIASELPSRENVLRKLDRLLENGTAVEESNKRKRSFEVYTERETSRRSHVRTQDENLQSNAGQNAIVEERHLSKLSVEGGGHSRRTSKTIQDSFRDSGMAESIEQPEWQDESAHQDFDLYPDNDYAFSDESGDEERHQAQVQQPQKPTQRNETEVFVKEEPSYEQRISSVPRIIRKITSKKSGTPARHLFPVGTVFDDCKTAQHAMEPYLGEESVHWQVGLQTSNEWSVCCAWTTFCNMNIKMTPFDGIDGSRKWRITRWNDHTCELIGFEFPFPSHEDVAAAQRDENYEEEEEDEVRPRKRGRPKKTKSIWAFEDDDAEEDEGDSNPSRRPKQRIRKNGYFVSTIDRKVVHISERLDPQRREAFMKAHSIRDQDDGIKDTELQKLEAETIRQLSELPETSEASHALRGILHRIQKEKHDRRSKDDKSEEEVETAQGALAQLLRARMDRRDSRQLSTISTQPQIAQQSPSIFEILDTEMADENAGEPTTEPSTEESFLANLDPALFNQAVPIVTAAEDKILAVETTEKPVLSAESKPVPEIVHDSTTSTSSSGRKRLPSRNSGAVESDPTMAKILLPLRFTSNAGSKKSAPRKLDLKRLALQCSAARESASLKDREARKLSSKVTGVALRRNIDAGLMSQDQLVQQGAILEYS
jgi:hypothetical protein